jgi:peptide/nickel transport system substrate-binding protein
MWLAESVDLSPDGRQVKVNLRKGVQFHDGKPLTSADVQYSLLKVRDVKTQATQHRQLSLWFDQQSELPDANTIILKSSNPRPAVFDLFEYLLIADEKTLESPGGQDKINGTGPWKLADRKVGISWDFVKSANYWRSDRPYLDGFQVQLFADAQAKTVAFESGATDILEGASLRDVARFEAENKYNLVGLPGSLYFLAMNMTKPPFDNKLARQAMHHAVDRKRIMDTIFQGKGEVRNLPWGTSSEAYDPAKANATPFDLDKAKAMWQQSGASTNNFEIICSAPNVEIVQYMQLVQGDFAKMGLNVALKPLETAAWSDQLNARTYVGMNGALTSFINIRPSTLPSTSSFFNTDPDTNRQGWTNPEYARLVKAAESEPDAAKRKALLFQLNDLFLEDSPIVFIGAANLYLVGQKNVHDFGRDNNYGMVLHDTWIG